MIMLGPESVLLALLVVLPWAVVRLLAHVPLRRAIAEGLFAAYVVAVLGVVMLPLRAMSAQDVPFLWNSINLVPMRTVVDIVQHYPGRIVQQLVGNVLLFVPLGFLLPSLWTRLRTAASTVVVALAASVAIELAQAAMLFSLVSQRSVDVDDVILNVLGALLGYLVWRTVCAARPDSVVEAATERT